MGALYDDTVENNIIEIFQETQTSRSSHEKCILSLSNIYKRVKLFFYNLHVALIHC